MIEHPHDGKKMVLFQVRLDRHFLDEIDRRALGKHLSRNAYVKACIQQVMNLDDAKEELWSRVLSKREKDPYAQLNDDERVAIQIHTEPFSFL